MFGGLDGRREEVTVSISNKNNNNNNTLIGSETCTHARRRRRVDRLYQLPGYTWDAH